MLRTKRSGGGGNLGKDDAAFDCDGDDDKSNYRTGQ